MTIHCGEVKNEQKRKNAGENLQRFNLLCINEKRNLLQSLGRAHWIQFQKESKIKTKEQNQNTIKEAHSCLIKTVLQASEKTISKPSPKTKKRPLVVW